jgi:outer membrane receptor protein involved in Fe transport
MKLGRIIIALFAILTTSLLAQKAEEGIVTGSVVDKTTGKPAEYVAVALKNKADSKTVRTGATDGRGAFALEKVPFGEYKLVYSYVGADTQETPSFVVDAQHRAYDLGRLTVADASIKMDKVEVSSRKEAFYNSIDRKVYNVGKDIQSATGAASDLLQNIPSIQVDIEGNVSLRGNESVLVLIDGKTSALMGANRAAVLEQMPADSIERIEVITNPSAKYKPDGTAGIINLVMKKKRDAGISSTVRVSVGNDRRYNASVMANYNPGKYNVFGSYSVRQDDRLRYSWDTRQHFDPTTNTTTSTEQKSTEHGRPLSHIAQTGGEYKIDDQNKVGASASYNYRSYTRRGTEVTSARDGQGVLTSDYDRQRTDPESEKDFECRANYQHTFPQEGHELNVEFKAGDHQEQEDNHYANVYRVPAIATTFDNELIKQSERTSEALVEYVRPFGDDSKLESGYSREASKIDMDFLGSSFNAATNAFVKDTTRSNRFIYSDTIHALYATYGRPIGSFGFLAGVRLEQAYIDTHQVTANIFGSNDYFRLYPSLHLSYNVTENGQIQLNYSHRVRRPEGDDLNPFPEYQDPFNLRAGNPHLKPEDTHSIETGYQYKKDDTTYLGTVYYRETYHGMTEVTRYVNGVTFLPDPSSPVLLTTKENLATSRSSGLELAATRSFGSLMSLNFSSNVYRNQIDASNLGFSTHKSAIAWNAKLSANIHASKNDLIQFNTNYTAKRLTPQGYRLPTYVANIGLRHDFKDKKLAMILTVSDVFNSLKDRTHLDTPALHEDITRRRSPRILYVGFIYNFGKPAKKAKEDMQFDNQL